MESKYTSGTVITENKYNPPNGEVQLRPNPERIPFKPLPFEIPQIEAEFDIGISTALKRLDDKWRSEHEK